MAGDREGRSGEYLPWTAAARGLALVALAAPLLARAAPYPESAANLEGEVPAQEPTTQELHASLDLQLTTLAGTKEGGPLLDAELLRSALEIIDELGAREGDDTAGFPAALAVALSRRALADWETAPNATLEQLAHLGPRLVAALPRTTTDANVIRVTEWNARVLFGAGRPDVAEQIYVASLEFFAPLGPMRTFALRGIIRSLIDQGRFAEAHERLGEEQRIGGIQLMLLFADAGALPEFAPLLDVTMRVSGLGDRSRREAVTEAFKGCAMSLSREASILLDEGLVARAAIANDRASQFLAASGKVHKNSLRTFAAQRNEILLSSARYAACIESCDVALESPAFAGDPDGKEARARVLLQRAVAQRMIGRLDDAALSLGKVLADDHATAQVRWSANLWLAEIGLDRPDLADPTLQRRALHHAIESGSGSATSPLEAARLCSLDSALAADSAGPEFDLLEDSVDALIQSWAELPERRGGRAFLRTANVLGVLSELVAAKRRSASDDETCEYALALLARIHSIGGLARSIPGDAFDVSEFRALLAGVDGGALVYLPGPRHSFVFAVDGSRATIGELPTSQVLASTLDDLARRVRTDVIPSPDVPSLVLDGELADAADDLLPASIRPLLGTWKCVGIVGVELIRSFPVEALEIGGEALGETHAAGYLPSLPVIATLARRARDRSAHPRLDVVLVAGVRHGPWARANAPGLGELGLTSRDLEPIVAAHVPDRTSVRIGARAGRAGLRSLGPAETRQIAIVSHARREPGVEQPVAVLLDEAPDAEPGDAAPILDAAFVRELSAPTLVVVVACGAGFEPARQGDAGSASLTGAWLAAGAAAVVEPRGDLPLGPALAHLQFFEDAIAEGASTAEALRLARVQLGEVLGVPHTGALFHAVGWPFEQIVDAPPPTKGLHWVATLAALAAGSVLALAGWKWTRRAA